MSIFNLISMFGGLSLLLYGMRLMGDGLKNSSAGSPDHRILPQLCPLPPFR